MNDIPHPDRRHPLAGAAALVTGGSRTTGAEIARTLARHGMRVAVNYHRSEADANELCDALQRGGTEALAVQADVTSEPDVERMVEVVWRDLGPIDLLVNNVGPYADAPYLELDAADFDRVLAGNVRSTFLVTRAAGRRMKQRGAGCIVNIAATDFRHRSHSVYGLAKQSVVFFTEQVARELAPEVRVNAIAPDLIADNEDMDDKMVRTSVGATPLGRLVTRREIGEAIVAICLPPFDFVTGQTIALDGGRNIPQIPFSS